LAAHVRDRLIEFWEKVVSQARVERGKAKSFRPKLDDP
jgi:hypothetical protein